MSAKELVVELPCSTTGRAMGESWRRMKATSIVSAAVGGSGSAMVFLSAGLANLIMR